MYFFDHLHSLQSPCTLFRERHSLKILGFIGTRCAPRKTGNSEYELCVNTGISEYRQNRGWWDMGSGQERAPTMGEGHRTVGSDCPFSHQTHPTEGSSSSEESTLNGAPQEAGGEPACLQQVPACPLPP